jgi:ABC-type branched-subunit amino acid transport system permease subunit
MKEATIGLCALAIGFTLVSALHSVGSGGYLAYLFQHQLRLDGWAVLSALDIAFAALGILGSWIALRRRAYRWAILFLAIQLPMPTIMGGSRCDTQASCAALGWAALPPSLLD